MPPTTVPHYPYRTGPCTALCCTLLCCMVLESRAGGSPWGPVDVGRDDAARAQGLPVEDASGAVGEGREDEGAVATVARRRNGRRQGPALAGQPLAQGKKRSKREKVTVVPRVMPRGKKKKPLTFALTGQPLALGKRKSKSER